MQDSENVIIPVPGRSVAREQSSGMPAVSARMGEDAQFSQEWPQARGQGLRRAASAFLIEKIATGLLVQNFSNIVAAVPTGDAAQSDRRVEIQYRGRIGRRYTQRQLRVYFRRQGGDGVLRPGAKCLQHDDPPIKT